jgi:hypothetical protein
MNRRLLYYLFGLLRSAEARRMQARLDADPALRERAAGLENGFGAVAGGTPYSPSWTVIREGFASGGVPVRIRPARRRRDRLPIVLGAAAVLAMGFVAWILVSPGISSRRGWTILQDGIAAPLTVGREIAPAAGETADIRLFPFAQLEVRGPARFQLEAADPQPGKTRFYLASGRLDAEIFPGALPGFVLLTPHAEIALRGTRFSAVVSADRTAIELVRGTLEVRDATGASRRIEQDSRLEAGPAGFREPPAKVPVPAVTKPVPRPAAPRRNVRVSLTDGRVLHGRVLSHDGRTLRLATGSGTVAIPASAIGQMAFGE